MRCPHRAREAEMVHLHRRRPQCENSRTAVARKAHQIDGDVDLVLSQETGHFPIADIPDVDDAAEAAHQTRTHLAAVALGEGHSERVEFRFVMVFEHAGHEVRDSRVVEIARKIGEPDLAVPVALPAPQRLCGRRIFVRDADARGGQLVGRFVEKSCGGKRRNDRFSGAQACRDRGPMRVESAPIATLKPEEREKAACIFVFGVERQQAFAVRGGVLEALHDHQRVGPVVQRFRAVGRASSGPA